MSKKVEMMEQQIEIGDGEYTLVMKNEPGKFVFKSLRYGEEWRDLVGDNLVLAMFHEIEDLRERIQGLEVERSIVNLYIDQI